MSLYGSLSVFIPLLWYVLLLELIEKGQCSVTIYWSRPCTLILRYHVAWEYNIYKIKTTEISRKNFVKMYSKSKKKKEKKKKKERKKHPCLLQYKLLNRNETGTNHHGLLSTSAWCFEIFLRGVPLHKRSLPNFNFFNVIPQFFQRNRKVCFSNYLETNFHCISNISLRVIRRKDYSSCEVLRRKFFVLNISGGNAIKWRKC